MREAEEEGEEGRRKGGQECRRTRQESRIREQD